MFKMIVAISLMSVIVEMFLSSPGFKKYIKAIMGVFTFLIIVESVFSLEPLDMNFSILDEAQRISEITLSQTERELIYVYENNIREALVENQIEIETLNVECDGNMTIKKIHIKLKDLSYKEKTTALLIERFGLHLSVMEIT